MLNSGKDTSNLESKNSDENGKDKHISLYAPNISPLRDKRIPFACVVNQMMLQANQKQSHR